MQKNAGLPATSRRPLELIYVSSDANQRQYDKMHKNRFWNQVPFKTKTSEIKGLKKYFKVCAKHEIEKLQLEREFDIPLMIVMSGTTHKVLSKTGVQELKREGTGVMTYWRNLAKKSNANANTKIAK